MELKIYSPTESDFISEIKWNHEDIKKEVAEKVSYYANLVYTDDQIKEAKADKAKLNKFVQALESKRKEVKKQCLAPYEDFEKKMKEIIAIVNEPILMIDQQIKAADEQKKAEKLELIQEYWNKVTSPDHPLTLQRVMDQKWLHSTISIKSIQEAINGILAKYAEDIATLQNLHEFSFEAVEVYKSTLDLGKAIQEGKRLSDIQKRKIEAEKAMEESVQKISEATKQAAKAVAEAISFTAYLTVEDAAALKNFFESRNIQFKAIEGFEELKERSAWLSCLEMAGVDNWEGYEYAMELSKNL